MAAKGALLASNVGTVADTTAVDFPGGGRAVIATVATTYPTTCQLQYLGPDSTTWINIGSNITANAVTAFDLPAGKYRLHLTGGTVAALYASLATVPYI